MGENERIRREKGEWKEERKEGGRKKGGRGRKNEA